MKDEKNLRKRWITDWWPQRLNLKILKQNCPNWHPYGQNHNYIKEIQNLNVDTLIKDLKELMKKNQDWWPADFGHYGPLFVRLAWHSAGSYRIHDGRGGARNGSLRFPPRINWPDNIGLDKAIKLLWPIKKKYGKKISWADLIILAGTVALEDMGMEIMGFSLGREDIYEPDESTDWGPEEKMLTGKERFKDNELKKPYAATEMGLIYVNPAGPEGNPDPVESAKEIRLAFARMGMNDEETVALIAGGHAFGKCHGAGPNKFLGTDPSSSTPEHQGLGWKYNYKHGKGSDTYISGFEVTWSSTPTKFGIQYLQFLFRYEWELEKSPDGKPQWVAKDAPEIIPDAHNSSKMHKPKMLTADLALRYDPIYSKIAKTFLEKPKEFEKTFAKAWFKLTHRDMGPKKCYFGPYVPKNEFIWQDPMPKWNYDPIDHNDINILKEKILSTELTVSQLVYTAWSSASTYRDSDRRGGANGAKIRLYPMNNWKVNHPDDLKQIVVLYEKIQQEFNNEQKSKGSNKRVSIADLIIIGGCAAIEKAAQKAGFNVEVPVTPGRIDTTQEQIEVDFYKEIEPFADGFRNYFKYSNRFDENDIYTTPEYFLVDKANLLTLTIPEMVVLIGGLRVLGAVYNYSNYGVLTNTPGVLTNDFFVNLLDMKIEWKQVDENRYLFEGYDRKSGNLKFKATRVDLIIGHHDELRAVAEVYASDDAKEKFIYDFIKAWNKIVNLDRFDLRFEGLDN
ncbi:catalase/peroxidase HPI [Deferribacter abyssi]|uniref:catalase/peroxidase HPI n=1 Tax=Deferribacter abyssi TaxID=213806 RepID=UPI003C2A4F02